MFTGTVQSTSHEGGLMVAFDGSSPSLNAIIVLSEDGTYIGKVDGVIGSTEQPLAHVAHIDRSLNIDDLLGQTVTIRPKKKREERDRDRQRSDRRARDDGGRRASRDDRGNDRRQRFDRNGGDRRGPDRGRGRQNNFENNDWDCPACNNSNFARRTVCNRCEAPRPGAGQPARDQRRFNDRSSRGGGRDDRRERRNDRSGTFNDNDWDCPECSNSNFSFRQSCNRCDAPRPGGRSTNNRSQGGRSYGGRSRDGDRSYGGRRDDRNGGRSYGGRSDDRNGGRSTGGRSNERQHRDDGERRNRDNGDNGGRGGDRRARNQRPDGQQYRRARGKKPGHAHNREPRDFRDGPRRFRRSDDD